MDVVELYEGLIYTLPEQPKHELIVGYDLPTKDQKWKRVILPSNWEEMSSEDQDIFAFEEDRKCDEGEWFYNNGVPTYITGDHYHYLTWFKIDSGYPDYRDRDKRWFYHWQLCDIDSDCIGQCYGKLRRDGYSFRVDSIMLNRARKTFDSNFGIVSKTGEDAKEMFNKLVHGFLSYPPFMKPTVQSAEDVKKALIFKTPQQRVTFKNRVTKKEVSLNTSIDWKNTKENAYDGFKLKILGADECFGKGTKILCEGFVFKNIEDIKVGENIITEGGGLVSVAKLCRGEDEMFLIKQPYGKSFVCNSQHRLYLETRKRSHGAQDKIVKISPVEYLTLKSYERKTTYRVSSNGLFFDEKTHIIPSYLMGVWLGDGKSSAFQVIVNMEKDVAIYNYIIDFCSKNKVEYSIYECDSEKCKYIQLKSNDIDFIGELKRLGVYKNKHIPLEYLMDSESNRLALLAGIIDTDGYFNKGAIHIGMSRESLIKDIYNLCGSLGFSVGNIKKKRTNFGTFAYSVSISGDLDKIPTIVKRKGEDGYKKSYVSRRCKVDVVSIGRGEYFGITLKTENDDERRLILEDFTISMNTGKWEETNVEKWYNIAKTCVTLGRRIIGKIFFGSTVNEAKKGGANFKAIWDKSSIKEKTENGRTNSGLWRYFVPAFDGIEGFIDEYGMSVIDTPEVPVMGIDGVLITIGAKPYYEAERKAKQLAGDIVGYFEEIRQRPFSEDEMFRDPANERASFDIDKIYQQLDHNLGNTTNHLVRGNFVWKDGQRDTEVVWEADVNGKWLVYWMPKGDDRNKVTLKYGQKAPANTHEGCFSTDPIDHKYTSSNKKSMAASHGFRKLNIVDGHDSNIFVCQYWARPSDPSIFYEDMLMQCVFYGWEILGESNKPGCINHFRNRGYEHYLMDRPAFTHSEYSEKNQKEKWIPNTGTIEQGIRRMLVEHLQSYVYQNVGTNSVTGMMGCCMFDDTLKDWAKFNVEDWTDYDLTVSAMYAIIASKSYAVIKQESTPINLFKKFDNRGMVSKEIK